MIECNCRGAVHLVCKPKMRVPAAKDPLPKARFAPAFEAPDGWQRWEDKDRSLYAAQHVIATIAKLGAVPDTFRYTPPHYHTWGEFGPWAPGTQRGDVGRDVRERTCACGEVDREYQTSTNPVEVQP